MGYFDPSRTGCARAKLALAYGRAKRILNSAHLRPPAITIRPAPVDTDLRLLANARDKRLQFLGGPIVP